MRAASFFDQLVDLHSLNPIEVENLRRRLLFIENIFHLVFGWLLSHVNTILLSSSSVSNLVTSLTEPSCQLYFSQIFCQQ